MFFVRFSRRSHTDELNTQNYNINRKIIDDYVFFDFVREMHRGRTYSRRHGRKFAYMVNNM